jgi:hypothetical protein
MLSPYRQTIILDFSAHQKQHETLNAALADAKAVNVYRHRCDYGSDIEHPQSQTNIADIEKTPQVLLLAKLMQLLITSCS